MTEDQEELILKAQQSLAAAQLLLANQYADFSHSGVISAFGKEFTRKKRVPQTQSVGQEQAAKIVEQAGEFLQVVRSLL